MIKKTFEKINEDIYYEKLDNGIDVYLYKTDKTKNFYLSISVKYGANITKYKIGNESFDIIPGSAHFLEHKVMALSENKEISKRINDLGSLANAWTSYYGTNYNIFGSINLIENLKLLLDIFYNININEKSVNEEKGIIGEEIDMYKDQIDALLYSKLFNNLFHNSYAKNTVIGERSDIEKITAESLNRVYNDYYVPNNTFIVVTGNFDENEVMNVIKEYMNKLKLKPKKLPKKVTLKEKDTVVVPYEEIQKDMENDRVKYSIKINKKKFGIKKDVILEQYLKLILSNNISPTSKLYEKYKNENIIISMGSSVNIIDDYVIITINAFTTDGEKFINNIKKDITKMKLNKNEFERKKKIVLKNSILYFDNIEDIEYVICISLMMDNEIEYNKYSEIMNLNYDEALRILNILEFDNVSIIRTIK